MKKLITVAILLSSSFCASSNIKSAEQILFKKIITAINTNDIKNISESDYDDISKHISNGKASWIDLYPELNKKPFLGITSFQEGLNISMAYALPKNPSEVLKFVNETNINYICGIPFIEPTQSEVNSYYLKTSLALKNVTSGSHWKHECLSMLESQHRMGRH